MSSKQNDRHIIWSDIHLDFEDWRADLEEQYPDLSEDELIQKMYEINSEYLGDERMNLNVQLSQPILVVADIGRWDGRYDGYAEIKTGNIKTLCFFLLSGDYRRCSHPWKRRVGGKVPHL